MANQVDLSRHLKIVEKIPFVRGLSMNQVKNVLQAGHIESHPSGHVLCREGDKSTAIYILLVGELAVKDGAVELARVAPVDLVGEMGVVTNQPRCATIEVVEDATMISVGKMAFEALLRKDVDLAARIYKNMLNSLSHKLRQNNQRVAASV